MEETPTPRIIIVEDERPMAKILKLKFDKEGFKADIAFNGEEAFEMIQETQYDFMLLDLIMPKLDGLGLLRKMKENRIKVPFIVTSNLSQPQDVERTKELGAKEYIIKSNSTIKEIIQAVRSHLGMKFKM